VLLLCTPCKLMVSAPLMLCCAIVVTAAGRFEEEVAAAKAYDKAAVHLYGRNACTNFGLEACHHDNTEVWWWCCVWELKTLYLHGMGSMLSCL
jgi:hypothetical protein